ncbi:unnamed protein product, partial [Laminaria digitata]
IFPQEYQDFLSYLSFFNFDISAIMSYTCLFSPNFYGRFKLITITPLVVLMMLAITYCVAQKRCSSSPEHLMRMRSRHLSAALFVMFFVYSSVSSAAFQMLACEEIGDLSLLRADYSISCMGGKYAAYVSCSLGIIIVFSIGMPAFLWIWVSDNREHLKTPDRQTTAHLQPFSSVWSTYKPSRYYYEVVEYGRRLALSWTSVFLVPSSVNHIAVVLCLAGVFLFISESLSPFQNSVDMSLYRWGNGVVLASMFLALLTKADESSDESLSVFGWVLILSNIVMIVAVVGEALFL